jgi:hypothetical protein
VCLSKRLTCIVSSDGRVCVGMLPTKPRRQRRPTGYATSPGVGDAGWMSATGAPCRSHQSMAWADDPPFKSWTLLKGKGKTREVGRGRLSLLDDSPLGAAEAAGWECCTTGHKRETGNHTQSGWGHWRTGNSGEGQQIAKAKPLGTGCMYGPGCALEWSHALEHACSRVAASLPFREKEEMTRVASRCISLGSSCGSLALLTGICKT